MYPSITLDQVWNHIDYCEILELLIWGMDFDKDLFRNMFFTLKKYDKITDVNEDEYAWPEEI